MVGNLASDVRKGVRGFATTVRVTKRAAGSDDGDGEVAEDGDAVELHYVCTTESGEVLQSSREGLGEPLQFEVGSHEVMGNPLFKALDRAAVGLRVGDTAEFAAEGGEYDRDLLFNVPKEHPEVQRLAGELAEKGDTLREGAVVVLANDQPAVIRGIGEDSVQIDANHPLAGAQLQFEVEVLRIGKGGFPADPDSVDPENK